MQFYGSTPEEAFAARDLYREQTEKGFSSRQTVSEYALPWLKRSFPSVADSTYTGLAIHLQHLIDSIGDKQLSEVLPSDIKGIYADQYKGRSNSYIRSAKQLFCALFDSAQADKLITSNPARDKTAKPGKGKAPKERILTAQQREYIETLCTDHRAFPAVMTMLYAGLRPQECKALNIDRDIDFENDIITVQETAHVNGTKYEVSGEMKTDWSKRTVPLFKPLKTALQGRTGMLVQSAHGEQITQSSWKTLWRSYIFSMETAINGTSKRWYGKTKDQQIKKAAGKLQPWIEFDIVPYTLRHAFCAMICRDNNVDINTCRRWMGHSDAKMILKVYDSVSSDREKNEREKVEKQWNRVQNGVQDETGT
jgi:integrase